MPFSKVIATAPTRVDLAGGTLDLWPIHNLLPLRATVNVAVSLNATVTIEPSKDGKFHLVSDDQNLADSGDFGHICKSKNLGLLGILLTAVWDQQLPPIKMTTSAKSPAGAGLGGSSCLSVTVLKALWTAKERITGRIQNISEEQLVRTAQDIESVVIHAPTGIQDYWGAVRGGINIIEYPFGNTTIQTLPGSIWDDQGFKLICCYSGKSRASAINNWEIFKGIYDRDQKLIDRMKEIGEVAAACATAVKSKEWNKVIESSHAEWLLRCKLWPAIETTETRAIDTAAKQAGAIFTRVCGAGGGGVMAVFAPQDRVQSVCQSMTAAGGQVLDVTVGGPGLSVSAT
jgi:D-glycero-alpha-D-manno-heptose-7-phosphate kinase